MSDVCDALRTARNVIHARGWYEGGQPTYAVSKTGTKGAVEEAHLPVCLISSLAEAHGHVYRRAYNALLHVTGAASLWTWQQGRTRADALHAIEDAIKHLQTSPSEVSQGVRDQLLRGLRGPILRETFGQVTDEG